MREIELAILDRESDLAAPIRGLFCVGLSGEGLLLILSLSQVRDNRPNHYFAHLLNAITRRITQHPDLTSRFRFENGVQSRSP
jgi:hypothetical protein